MLAEDCFCEPSYFASAVGRNRSNYLLAPISIAPRVRKHISLLFCTCSIHSITISFYVKHAIIRVRKGKLGVDDHGRALRKFSKADIYIRVLNYVNNNCYFGIMTTLFSAFSCFMTTEENSTTSN